MSFTISQAKTAKASLELTSRGAQVMRLRAEAEIARIDAILAMEAALKISKDALETSRLAQEAYAKSEAIKAELFAAEKEAAAADTVLRTAQAESAIMNAQSKIKALCTEVIEPMTTISVESRGDKWTGVVMPEGFLVNGKLYTSPSALSKAHASRITANHPHPTNPGSGWVYIMVESGKHKGRSIQEAFDAHFQGPW